MKTYVIISAGGAGKRMGAKVPKQFLELDGKPILLRTIELFTSLDIQPEIILVLPALYIKKWQEYCVKNNLWIKHTIVEGGITRFHSVKSALKHVENKSIVVVHDGVRPFVPREMIEKMLDFKFTEQYAGIIPVLPIEESVREKVYDENGDMSGSRPVQRENFFTVQTPQIFDSTRLKLAYKRPYSQAFTDDASVLEASGCKVEICRGSKMNLKITTPEDLAEAKLIYRVFDK